MAVSESRVCSSREFLQFFFLNHLFIYFFKPFIYFLAVLGLHCCRGLSPMVLSGDSSLVVVHGLLIVVAPLAVDRGL